MGSRQNIFSGNIEPNIYGASPKTQKSSEKFFRVKKAFFNSYLSRYLSMKKIMLAVTT